MAIVTVNIKSAGEPDVTGAQEVNFDIVYQGKVMVNHTVKADVDNIKAVITDFATAYKAKYVSTKKLKAGDSFTIDV